VSWATSTSGEAILDDDFLILFNAHWEDIFFKLALTEEQRPWRIVLNTSTRLEDGEVGEIEPADVQAKVEGRSMVVLSRERK